LTAATPDQGHSARRFTSAQKVDAVLRVLSGASSDSVSRDIGVSLRRLERWKSSFIVGGSAELSKKRSADSKGWFQRQSGALSRWAALLLALAASVALLALLLQRSV
jgi:transposase-like protein